MVLLDSNFFTLKRDLFKKEEKVEMVKSYPGKVPIHLKLIFFSFIKGKVCFNLSDDLCKLLFKF